MQKTKNDSNSHRGTGRNIPVRGHATPRGDLGVLAGALQTPRTVSENLLTEAEGRVFEALRQVTGGSMYALAIKSVLNDFSLVAFLRLIITLKSQGRDNETVMKRILGPAFDPVMRL